MPDIVGISKTVADNVFFFISSAKGSPFNTDLYFNLCQDAAPCTGYYAILAQILKKEKLCTYGILIDSLHLDP